MHLPLLQTHLTIPPAFETIASFYLVSGKNLIYELKIRCQCQQSLSGFLSPGTGISQRHCVESTGLESKMGFPDLSLSSTEPSNGWTASKGPTTLSLWVFCSRGITNCSAC